MYVTHPLVPRDFGIGNFCKCTYNNKKYKKNAKKLSRFHTKITSLYLLPFIGFKAKNYFPFIRLNCINYILILETVANSFPTCHKL